MAALTNGNGNSKTLFVVDYVCQAQVVRAAIPILLGLPFNNNINILELPFPLFRAAISMFKANKSFSKFIVHRETNLINYSRL